LDCPECGAPLEIEFGTKTYRCKYCDSSVKLPSEPVTFVKKEERIEVTVGNRTTVYNSVDEMPHYLRLRYQGLDSLNFKRDMARKTNVDAVIHEMGASGYLVDGKIYKTYDELPEESKDMLQNIESLSPAGSPRPSEKINYTRSWAMTEDGGNYRMTFAPGLTRQDIPDITYFHILIKYGKMSMNQDHQGKTIVFCPTCQKETMYKRSLLGAIKCQKCKKSVYFLDIGKGEVKVREG
ncbi:MAG: hypothetical protein KAS16_00925, partial [Thermoplasmata archaeon]|nr:hypothetical protein [Thermoplasmata archaeon]